jgi:dihydroorotase
MDGEPKFKLFQKKLPMLALPPNEPVGHACSLADQNLPQEIKDLIAENYVVSIKMYPKTLTQNLQYIVQVVSDTPGFDRYELFHLK